VLPRAKKSMPADIRPTLNSQAIEMIKKEDAAAEQKNPGGNKKPDVGDRSSKPAGDQSRAPSAAGAAVGAAAAGPAVTPQAVPGRPTLNPAYG
jgi:hypothetical protein